MEGQAPVSPMDWRLDRTWPLKFDFIISSFELIWCRRWIWHSSIYEAFRSYDIDYSFLFNDLWLSSASSRPLDNGLIEIFLRGEEMMPLTIVCNCWTLSWLSINVFLKFSFSSVFLRRFVESEVFWVMPDPPPPPGSQELYFIFLVFFAIFKIPATASGRGDRRFSSPSSISPFFVLHMEESATDKMPAKAFWEFWFRTGVSRPLWMLEPIRSFISLFAFLNYLESLGCFCFLEVCNTKAESWNVEFRLWPYSVPFSDEF